MQRARALAVDVSPLRESVAFRALWGGQIVSLVGTHMRLVAVPFQVFAITKSSAAVGLLGLAEVVPLILFSIAGGTLADSIDRRRIMGVAQVLLAADSAVLAALTLAGRPSLPWIYGLVALAGARAGRDQRGALVRVPHPAHIVDPRHRPRGHDLRHAACRVPRARRGDVSGRCLRARLALRGA